MSPGAAAVAIVQDRSHEKTWLADNGFATAPFALINSEADLDAALAATGTPALLKVSRFGYDGKGQARVDTLADARAAFREFGGQPCVLEGFVKLECEVSVVLARDDAGRVRAVSRSPKTATKTASSTSPSSPPGCPTASRSRRARWRGRWPTSSAMSASWQSSSSSPTAA